MNIPQLYSSESSIDRKRARTSEGEISGSTLQVAEDFAASALQVRRKIQQS